MKDFNFKQTVWERKNKTFVVQVHHWVKELGVNAWNVYAFIYPKHPYFKQAQKLKVGLFQPCDLCFHGGVTYVWKHRNGNSKILSVKLGSDYGHIRDERFESIDTPEKAWEVFEDASALFDQLKAMKEGGDMYEIQKKITCD